MNFFCLLWTPLFYLFWVSLRPPAARDPGGLWALLFGSAFALTRFITGPWVAPGEFGLSRWLSVLVDAVGLPALIPFLFFVLFAVFRAGSAPGDPAGFALLWLIPEGILRSLNRAGSHDPVFLTLAPALWTALALGISLFIRFLSRGNRPFRAVAAFLGSAVLIPAAVTCYWAFFCRYLLLGWLFFALTLIPTVCSLASSLHRIRKQGQQGGTEMKDEGEPAEPPIQHAVEPEVRLRQFFTRVRRNPGR